MTYTVKPLIIKTKTNLHVGSGDMNYNIVDKTVQRDSITNVPIINASSLKGALRNHYDEVMPDTQRLDRATRDFIFGKEDNDNPSQGYVKFLDSYLLFLPLRAYSRPFYYVTSKANLLAFCAFYDNLNYDMDALKEEVENLDDNTIFDTDATEIEDVTCKKSTHKTPELQALFGEIDIAVFSNENFIDACEHLPIIARNKVETKDAKGEPNNDSNLWYEEIVPRESIFYTAQLDYSVYGNRVFKPANYKLKTFYDVLTKDFIQIGANASVGFGLCRFSEIALSANHSEDTQNAK